MVKKCNEECHIICDFCIYLEKTEDNRFDGESLCKKHNVIVEWASGCDSFHCFLLKDDEEEFNTMDVYDF